MGEASPQWLNGTAAPERFTVRENGVTFELSFREGASVGLFLDQRDNRRRFLVNHVAAEFPLWEGGPAGRTLLNAFAYTCGFSVCAGLAGAHTTSLDLSRKYLEWGRRNFLLNGLDPDAHEFIQGDARRLVAIVIKGLNGPITVKGAKFPGAIPLIPVDTQFPQYKDNQKLADVLNFVRTSWSNKTDTAITPDFIQKVRDEFKDRTMPWTEADVTSFPTPKQ